MFVHEPIVQLLGLYMAFAYGILYCMCAGLHQSYVILYVSVFITTMPSIFQDVYHDRIGIAGLHYLAFGVGLVSGSQINAMFIDRVYVSLKSRNGGIGKPEFRLRAYQCSALFWPSNNPSCCVAANIVPGTILLPTGLLITGWAAEKRVYWLVTDLVSDMGRIPCVTVKRCLQGIALVGAGVTTIFQNIQTYVIDSFSLHAASGEVTCWTAVDLRAYFVLVITSSCRHCFPAFVGWLWISTVRSGDVQRSRIRQR